MNVYLYKILHAILVIQIDTARDREWWKEKPDWGAEREIEREIERARDRKRKKGEDKGRDEKRRPVFGMVH